VTLHATLLTFLLVFAFNLAPALTPPTWMVLAYIAVVHHPARLVLAAVGAAAATCGRMMLARCSTWLVRHRLLAARTIDNLDVVAEQVRRHKRMTSGAMLFYAFSPLPSNQVFIAYGLLGLRLMTVALPFVLGRFVSYSFWIFTASQVSERLAVQSLKTGQFFGTYFVVGQVLTLVAVYLFTKIDWRASIAGRNLKWLRSHHIPEGQPPVPASDATT
jgi:hypothetical protein